MASADEGSARLTLSDALRACLDRILQLPDAEQDGALEGLIAEHPDEAPAIRAARSIP